MEFALSSVAASFLGLTLPPAIAPWVPVLAVAAAGVLVLGVLTVGVAAMLVYNTRKRAYPR